MTKPSGCVTIAGEDVVGVAIGKVERHAEPCPVCDETPRVLVAIHHPGMRHLTQELLRREHHCWVASELADGEPLGHILRRLHPDLLVVDASDFPACCRAAIAAFPPDRVIVIGPEPDHAYESAARRNGAGAWIPREHVGEELGPAMRHVLGCRHAPCPSGAKPNGIRSHPQPRSVAGPDVPDHLWP